MTIRPYENRTKRELDEAMRVLLQEKPLEQIRVKELTEVCGIRRQSFYYHFSDIYELFFWTIRREQHLIQKQQDSCLTWQQLLLLVLQRVDSTKAYYQTLLRISGQEGLQAIWGELFGEVGKNSLEFYKKRYAGAWNSDMELQISKLLRKRVDITWILLTYWINSESQAERDLLLDMLGQETQEAYMAAFI